MRPTKILFGVLLLLLSATVCGEALDKNDIRVLIDISGSMRTNDLFIV